VTDPQVPSQYPEPPQYPNQSPYPNQPQYTDPSLAPVAPQAEPVAAPPAGFDEKGRVKRTKVSGVWIGLIAVAIVLILLIVFIAQNLNTVGLHFLGFYGKVSFGLALLVAAVAGVLIAAVPGTVRIVQLRRSLRRNVDASGANRQ
jgi:uncharacterized integral membrane protein